MICPMCDKQIKDTADECPFCGYPIKEERELDDEISGMQGSRLKNGEIIVGSNAVSALCRVSALIIGVILFFSGIYIGLEISWVTAFYVWISGYLFCLLLYAVGELIKKAAEISDFAEIICREIKHK